MSLDINETTRLDSYASLSPSLAPLLPHLIHLPLLPQVNLGVVDTADTIVITIGILVIMAGIQVFLADIQNNGIPTYDSYCNKNFNMKSSSVYIETSLAMALITLE